MKKIYLLLTLVLLCTRSTFSQAYIPYREGKLWGLADTSGHVVVKPAYDEIEKVLTDNSRRQKSVYVEGGFFVKKNNKYGFIQGKHVIMPTIYQKLYCVDSLFIIDHHKINNEPVIGSSRDIVYNLRGEKLITDSIYEIEYVQHKMDNNLLYNVAAPGKKAGLLWYNKKLQKIEQWIVTGASFINIGGRSDKNTLNLFIYKNSEKTSSPYDVSFNAKTNKYDISPSKAIRQEPRLVIGDQLGLPTTIKNSYVLKNYEFKIIDNKAITYIKTRRNHENKIKADTIINNIEGGRASIKQFMDNREHSEWYSTKPENDSETEKVDSIFEYVNYIQFKNNNKSGLICGNTVIKPIYDSISNFKKVGYNIPFFLVGQISPTEHLMKWGMISANNKIIIPCIYDEVIPKGGGWLWIVRKDNLYGLVNSTTGAVILKPQYEKITPISKYASGYIIFHNGKYGYTDDDIACKPIFNTKVTGWTSFQNYKVFDVKNEKDDLIGYADKKGFTYFKN